MMPRLGRLVWLAYAALLGVAQASLAFAWAVHAHGAGGGSSGRFSHRTQQQQPQQQQYGRSLALQPTPNQQPQPQQQSPYCPRCLSLSATASAAAPPPPLQHAATVRLCTAIIRGARGGGFRARSKAAAAASASEEQPLLATKSRGRSSSSSASSSTALKAASASFEQQPPARRGSGGGQQQSGWEGDEGLSEMDGGEGAPLLPKQELSSTIGILAAGAAVMGLAAVLPTGLQPGAPTVLAALLAALKPAPGVVLAGPALYWRIFLAGGVCASISHGWAVPLDVVKTRLQTDPDRYQGLGIWGAFAKIRREEGPGMLLKGLGATLAGYSIQGALKYGLYAIFKQVVKGWLPAASIFVTFALASIIADFIASTALCPLEATRIRLVADPSFAKGTLEGISRLVECEGPGSIFKGMPAILAKQLPYTIVQLCGFELITWLFYSWDATAAFLHSHKGGMGQWIVSFGSAMITAVFASLASQPGDVILSRVNKDRSSQPVLATMKDTVRELGVKGLFKGTRARLLHVGMIVTIQLVIYDFVKQLVGLPATGAH